MNNFPSPTCSWCKSWGNLTLHSYLDLFISTDDATDIDIDPTCDVFDRQAVDTEENTNWQVDKHHTELELCVYGWGRCDNGYNNSREEKFPV